ncbi:threonine aldolase family protein [Hydromonas duriensis]|uniref:L-threonine aldolase n=1 Tax=Hydromonas duriensis TaxID=1527608 RepID=A0A4R6Y986_9BURK|nr:aminotransferase class I/II-fold pyridoxal phosphate-dependent enzyme [Hydromonas duriensis]TDR31997.1 L-threonine aldolase [Hydromonas duriensis]
MHFQFYNDYSETAHPACMAALAHEPTQQLAGYGLDDVSAQAADAIRAVCKSPKAAVHFVSGGTQANLTMLAAMLRPFEAIIAAQTGHIYSNETGAIEATGHKIIAMPATQGKLTPASIEAAVAAHPWEHTVRARVVFISQATELGTVYSLAELRALRACCDTHGLYLYMDGARLGAALMSHDADWDLADIAALADVFYIGGTKNGAVLGEAIVIVHPDLQVDFRYHLKQRGALLAKGRVVGSQFLALFSNDLFQSLAAHANACAERLQNGLLAMGVAFETLSSTNLIFPTLPNHAVEQLQQRYGFHIWKKVSDTHQTIRLVTSWATPMDKVDDFLNDTRLALAEGNS